MNTFGLDAFCSFVVCSLLAAEFSNGAASLQLCDRKYNNWHELNKGNDGTVYRCNDIGNPSRQVALKLFNDDETFASETRFTDLMKNSPHPEYFLSLLDTCMTVSPRKNAAVFELVTHDLYEFGVKFSQPYDIRSLSHQIIEAVNTLHKKGLIHRDVKPRNIGLVGLDTMSVKLFDLAYTEEISGTRVYEFKGTPPYMAPEILIEERLEIAQAVKHDMWAVGVTLLVVASRCEFVISQLTVGLFELDSLQGQMKDMCFSMFIYIYIKGVFGSVTLADTEIESIQGSCNMFTEIMLRQLLSRGAVQRYKKYYNALISNARENLIDIGLNSDEAEQYIQLVQWLLTFDVYLRPTADQAAAHDFFAQSVTEPSSTSVFDSGVGDQLQMSSSQNNLDTGSSENLSSAAATIKLHTTGEEKETKMSKSLTPNAAHSHEVHTLEAEIQDIHIHDATD